MADPTAQRGNILFLILLAVVLFAALSYAVTSSTRGGGNDASNEKVAAQVAEIDNYFALLDAGVQRMMLTGGLKDYELNFYGPDYMAQFVWGNNDNTNCTEDRCRVFHKNGGGVTGRKTATLTRDPVGNAGTSLDAARVFYIGIPGAGTSAPDIAFAIGGVSMKVCAAINQRLGISSGFLNTTFNSGTSLMYQFALPVGPIPDAGSVMGGLTPAQGSVGTFCTCASQDYATCAANQFYPQIFHVLVAR